MNEELQSANQELQTINDELHQRSDELSHANAFLGSILAGLRRAVAVLDRDLMIRHWNYRAEDLWGLRDDEVQGKPFLNLDIGLPVEQLKPAIRSCLAGEERCPTATLEARNRRGKTIRCEVTCTPLAGASGGTRGVILLMDEQPDGKAP